MSKNGKHPVRILKLERGVARRRNRLVDFLKTLMLLVFLAGASGVLAYFSRESVQAQARVLDGDSLVLAGREIRLLGVDAPEYNQTCVNKNRGTEFSCGKQARSHLAKLVNGKTVVCNGWEHDRYDRLLAQCKAGETDLNRRMVRDGWAVSFGDYGSEEEIAKRQGAGLWSSSFETPSQWRENNREAHRSSVFGWMLAW